MKRILILIAVFIKMLGSVTLYSQTLFTETEINQARTADTVKYLSDEEKKVIFYMNLARLDGKRFFKSFFPDYVKEYNEKYSNKIKTNSKYWTSLIIDLYKIQNLGMLRPNPSLSTAAEFHATDLGKSGLFGHTSSDGMTFAQRMESYYPNYNSAGENCACGQSQALGIVCDLLLDNGVPSLGHRKNILNPEFSLAGIGIAPHTNCDPCCVIDFSI